MGYKKVNFNKKKSEKGQGSKKNGKMTTHKKVKYKKQWS